MRGRGVGHLGFHCSSMSMVLGSSSDNAQWLAIRPASRLWMRFSQRPHIVGNGENVFPPMFAAWRSCAQAGSEQGNPPCCKSSLPNNIEGVGWSAHNKVMLGFVSRILFPALTVNRHRSPSPSIQIDAVIGDVFVAGVTAQNIVNELRTE